MLTFVIYIIYAFWTIILIFVIYIIYTFLTLFL